MSANTSKYGFKHKLRLMPASIALIGLAIITVGCTELLWSMPKYLLTDGWQTVPAKIEDQKLFAASRRRHGTTFRSVLKYSYSWENNTYSGEARYYRTFPKPGEDLFIAVNPKDPSQSTKIGFDWSTFLLFFTALFVGTLLLWNGVTQKHHTWKQLKDPEDRWIGVVNIAICVLAPLFIVFYIYTVYSQAFAK